MVGSRILGEKEGQIMETGDKKEPEDKYAKKHAERLMASRLGRKTGTSLRIYYSERFGKYCCEAFRRTQVQKQGGVERKVAEYIIGKYGLGLCPFDMSYPGEEPFSQIAWCWGKYERFETLDRIEEWVKNFVDKDVKMAEELYSGDLGTVCKYIGKTAIEKILENLSPEQKKPGDYA